MCRTVFVAVFKPVFTSVFEAVADTTSSVGTGSVWRAGQGVPCTGGDPLAFRDH